MAYDEGLEQRIREAMPAGVKFEEKKMFGGWAVMVRGHMICGIVRQDLMVRVGPDGHEDALSRPHVRPMDFAGRPMKGMVYVAPAGLMAEGELEKWLKLALKYNAAQAPKAKKEKRS